MAKRKTTPEFRYKDSANYRAPRGERAKAIKAYTEAAGKAPPKGWNTAKILGRTQTLKSFPSAPAPAVAKVPAVSAPISRPSVPATVSVPAPAAKAAPGLIKRALSSPVAGTVGRVALAGARGLAVGIAVEAALKGTVGAYRDGVRGAGRGVVDAATLGFGTAAYDRKFGARAPDIVRDVKEHTVDTAIGVAGMIAGGAAGAKLVTGTTWGKEVIGGTGMAALVGAGHVVDAAIKSYAYKKMLSFPPETDKDRAETRKVIRQVEALKTGRRFSEHLNDKANAAHGKSVLGAGLKYSGYAMVASGTIPPVGAVSIAAGVGMAAAGAGIESHYDRQSRGLRRRAVAIDYLARRQRGDATSGTPYAVGQNASIAAFKQANARFNAQRESPARAGEFFDRTRRDPRTGKTINEKVRNPHYGMQ